MNWIEDIIERTLENCRDRKIVLWGKYEVSEQIKENLQNAHKIRNIIYIDADLDKADYKEVFPIEYIDGKEKELFLVIPLAVHDSIRQKLKRGGGYKEGLDYYYFSDCIKEMTEDYYEDAHGNRFIGRRDGIKFCFSGWDSTIKIGEGVKVDKTLTLYLYDGQVFELGNNVDVSETEFYLGRHFRTVIIGDDTCIKNALIHVEDGAELMIGEQVVCDPYKSFQRIEVQSFGTIKIGRKTTVCVGYSIVCTKGTKIIIGEDCMISWRLSIISADGHTIFDVNSGQAINGSDDDIDRKKVVLEDHVWVGMDCKILGDTLIGTGSVVAAGSVVKGSYPNNCILGGQIAKIIRRDISWCRNSWEKDIEACGEYIALTGER